MSAMTLSLTVVVPCHNEQAAIGPTIAAIAAAATGIDHEIVVVDDGSTDDTAAALERQGPAIRVVRHPTNRGYGAAIKSGIEAARGQWIAIIDADGTYPADRLPDLWAAREGVSMVIAARRPVGSARLDYRRPFRETYRRYGSWIVGRPVPDLNSGFRLVRRDEALRWIDLLPDGFSLTSTLTLAVMRSRGPDSVAFVQVDYRPRIGRSKISPLVDSYRMVRTVVRTGMLFAPLRAMTPILVAAWLAIVAAPWLWPLPATLTLAFWLADGRRHRAMQARLT